MGRIRPQHHLLIHSEQIDGRENDGEARHRAQPHIVLIDTSQQQELAHEAARERQGHGTEQQHQKRHRQQRRAPREAAQIGYQPGAGAPLDGIGDEEHSDHVHAVGQHLHHRALQADLGERKHARNHQPDVRERRISNEPLHVGLPDGDDGPVNNAHHGQHQHRALPVARALRQHRKQPAQAAVNPHFEHDAGQQHRGRRGRFGISIGLPGVEGEQRHFDGEGRENQPE